MRKNLAKHTAKKLPLAKRVLALCFALIFVCSCLLPAFANGTGVELDTPGTEVVEAADPGTEPEPMDLYDEPAAMDDDFAVADEPAALDDDFAMDDEPAAMDDDFAVDDEPAAMDDQVEKPVVDDEPAAMDNEVEKPVEGGEPPVADDTPAEEGATKTTTDASGNIVYEYDTSGTTFPEDDAAALPDGDQVLDQMDAAFSIPTNIYHFWLKKMSSYDLADIATDAETAEMTVEQYLAMYGTDKGCYHIMTAADGANLKDYQFADPTSNDDPEGNSRTFAGWYYTDELGDEQKFVFDEHLYVSESTTVEVYAKWKAEAKPVTTTAELNALETTVTVDGLAGVDTVKVSQLDEYDEADLAEAIEDKIDTEKNIDLYTFDLTPVDKDEKTVQPDSGKKATVTIKGFDILSTDTIKVFHKTNLEVEDLSNTAKLDANGNLTFKTESFSPFAVVVERAVEKSIDTKKSIDTVEISGPSQVEVGSQITLQGTDGYYWRGSYYRYSYHYWEITKNGSCAKIISGQSSSAVVIEGVSADTVTLKHWYSNNNNYWYKDDPYEVVVKNATVVDNTKNATVFLLLTPNSDKDSNATSQWGYGIPGAAIDVSGATGWEDDKNLKGDLSSYIKSWPNNGTQVTLNDGKIAWDMPLTTVGYSYVKDDGTQTSEDIIDQIWRQWSDEIKKQNKLESLDLKKEDIEHIYVVPYKISKGNGTSGTGDTQIKDLHIDSEIRVVCKGAFTAQFLVQDAGASEYTQVSSKTYLKGSTIPENNGESRLPKYPDKKVAENGVTYEFDGWYNEAGEKVEATGWDYLPTDEELVDGTVQFRARYVPITQNITITKHVTGLFGDKDREFNFSVSFSPAATDVTATKNLREGSTQDVANLSSFTLRHNDSITLNGVPVGTVITITESDASDYTVTATGATGSEQKGDNASFTYTVVANSASTQSLEDGESDIALMSTTEEVVPNNSITITNTFDAPVDNGVLLDTLPYILILVVVVGGGVLLFLRKRKNDDDE